METAGSILTSRAAETSSRLLHRWLGKVARAATHARVVWRAVVWVRLLRLHTPAADRVRPVFLCRRWIRYRMYQRPRKLRL